MSENTLQTLFEDRGITIWRHTDTGSISISLHRVTEVIARKPRRFEADCDHPEFWARDFIVRYKGSREGKTNRVGISLFADSDQPSERDCLKIKKA